MSIEKELKELINLPIRLLLEYDHVSKIQERIAASINEEDFSCIVNIIEGLERSNTSVYLLQFKQCLLSLESLASKLPSDSKTNRCLIDYFLNLPLDPFQGSGTSPPIGVT